MSGASSSISVAVRVRPFTLREAAQISKLDDGPTFFGDGSLAGTPKPSINNKGLRRIIKVVDENVLVFDPPESNPVTRFQKQFLGPQGKKVKDMRFGFDRVFDENATQGEVYEATSSKLLDSVLDGFNSTVFAYGATGCGKTHTISGTKQAPGIIFLTMENLFRRIDDLASEKNIELSLSYLEIYNETIRDLLVPEGNVKGGLQLREDQKQTIAVHGLSTHRPATVQEVMEMIVTGNTNRTMSPTEANATSSRSHAVLQVTIVQKARTAGLSEDHFASTLSIIDLAGSERASVTKNRGDRLLEGANINRSLLALGNCINALCDPSKRNHVPYRDSKLTRLLKFSLGGNCKTVMIVCVSPSSQHYDETHNTLKYADRAKNIKTKLSRNMINVNRHVSQYVKAIFELQEEVKDLKKRLDGATQEAMKSLTKQNSSRDMAMKEGIRRIRAAFDLSIDLRNKKLQSTKSLRHIDRRTATIKGWIMAFDTIFPDEDATPDSLGMIRQSADEALTSLYKDKSSIEHFLANEDNNWVHKIDGALRSSTQNLMNVEGVNQEMDIDTLTREANSLKALGEKDILMDLINDELADASEIEYLIKAHFEAVVSLSSIREMDSEQAAIEGAGALSTVIQACTDVTTQIIRPSGELIGMDTSHIGTPGKKRASTGYSITPVKKHYKPTETQGLFSPTRGTPKTFKVGTPKKGVQFLRKNTPKKKRVRWHDNVEDNEKAKSLPKEPLSFPEAPVAAVNFESEFVAPPTTAGPVRAPPQPVPIHVDAGLEEPPRRPPAPAVPPMRNSRMAIGFLSKKPDADDANSNSSSPDSQQHQYAQGPAAHSPLREFELSSIINRNSFDGYPAVSPPKPFAKSKFNNITGSLQNSPSSETDSNSYSPIDPTGTKPRYIPPKLSAPVQIKVKSALKRDSNPVTFPSTQSGGVNNSERPLPSSLTATTAAQRAKRRSPPRSPETGNIKIGNGPRRSVRESMIKPLALSPKSQAAIMKSSATNGASRRLTVNGPSAEALLGHLQKEMAGNDSMMSLPPMRESTGMMGRPTWR